MRVIAVLAVVVAAVAAVPSNPQRIVGGTETTIDNYPSAIVLLITINWSYYWQNCGGSIINSRSILTAAHCIIDDTAERWRIRAGSTYVSGGGTTHDTQSILIHPEYDSRTADNDVAILWLANEIVFSNNARAGSFAGSSYNLADNQVVWAAGWGRIYSGGPLSEELRHVQIWSVNQAECRRRYATVGNTVTDNMLCSGYLDVGGRDQCQGDSGGPLYHNGVIVGVSSWGRGCADAFFPGVSARVSRYITWIQANA